MHHYARTRPPVHTDGGAIHGTGEGERGVALILALLFSIMVSGLVISGTVVMQAHQAKIEVSFRQNAQATQFANAGLMEALGWFRKQSSQPVLAFSPTNDPAAIPPVIETLDEDIGIVREFPIGGALWGRYEVWKSWPGDPDPTRLAWRQRVEAEDISLQAQAGSGGQAWHVESIAYVFRRTDPLAAFNVAPNQVLATERLGTEIRRMVLAPPGQGALCARDGTNVGVYSRVNLNGGIGSAIVVGNDPGSVSQSGSPRIVGSPGITSVPEYDDSVQAVFGVPTPQLRVLADDRVDSNAEFPARVPANSLIYSTASLTFDNGRPLLGTGAVYVQGDVDLTVGNKSFFSGLLYIDGNLTVREPCEFNGTIIVTGQVTLDGQADWVNISYDDGVLNRLRTEIGQYRLSAATRPMVSRE